MCVLAENGISALCYSPHAFPVYSVYVSPGHSLSNYSYTTGLQSLEVSALEKELQLEA